MLLLRFSEEPEDVGNPFRSPRSPLNTKQRPLDSSVVIATHTLKSLPKKLIDITCFLGFFYRFNCKRHRDGCVVKKLALQPCYFKFNSTARSLGPTSAFIRRFD